MDKLLFFTYYIIQYTLNSLREREILNIFFLYEPSALKLKKKKKTKYPLNQTPNNYILLHFKNFYT